MLQSIVTKKGQTTIPKEIRELLKLKPSDRVFYMVEDQKVILKPLHGDILELRGSIPGQGTPTDFNEVLKTTRKKVGRKIAEGR